jgi:hypothetical protein
METPGVVSAQRIFAFDNRYSPLRGEQMHAVRDQAIREAAADEDSHVGQWVSNLPATQRGRRSKK